MATCPECDAEIDVDVYEVEKGDLLTCPECGSDLEVISVSPLEIEAVSDEDEEEDEDDEDEGDELDEEDEEEEEDWDK